MLNQAIDFLNLTFTLEDLFFIAIVVLSLVLLISKNKTTYMTRLIWFTCILIIVFDYIVFFDPIMNAYNQIVGGNIDFAFVVFATAIFVCGTSIYYSLAYGYFSVEEQEGMFTTPSASLASRLKRAGKASFIGLGAIVAVLTYMFLILYPKLYGAPVDPLSMPGTLADLSAEVFLAGMIQHIPWVMIGLNLMTGMLWGSCLVRKKDGGSRSRVLEAIFFIASFVSLFLVMLSFYGSSVRWSFLSLGSLYFGAFNILFIMLYTWQFFQILKSWKGRLVFIILMVIDFIIVFYLVHIGSLPSGSIESIFLFLWLPTIIILGQFGLLTMVGWFFTFRRVKKYEKEGDQTITKTIAPWNTPLIAMVIINVLLFFLLWDNIDLFMVLSDNYFIEMNVCFLIGFFIVFRYRPKKAHITRSEP